MSVFFQPFVGKNYADGGIFGKRVMVLGESHYCGEGCADCGSLTNHAECAAFTNNVVAAYLDENSSAREPWMNTYLKFERSLVGHETDWAERRQIWQSLMFCNYLQVAMDGACEGGINEQYALSAPAFYELIDKYRPQRIIVWGKQLWGKLPEDGRWRAGKPIMIDGYEAPTGSYALGGGAGEARIMAVYHPSVGYSWDRWHRVIEEFLK